MKLVQVIDADCCPPVLRSSLDEEEAGRLAAALKVMADPARLRLVSLIAAQPGGEACQCDLTHEIGLSQPTVSHHLRVLHEAGVLDREQRGRWAYYRIRSDPLRQLAQAISPVTRRAS
ncbi:MAG TPA: metalloregulator ArsR/SmtB family transcription factor [Actinomycetota bacterium]|nr:metalloregulator ArsR/SmtB family transcription factor [Actinomycetota bacterium]